MSQAREQEGKKNIEAKLIVGYRVRCKPAAVIAATNCLISYPSTTHFSLACVACCRHHDKVAAARSSHPFRAPLSAPVSQTKIYVCVLCAYFCFYCHRRWLNNNCIPKRNGAQKAKNVLVREKKRCAESRLQSVDSTCIRWATVAFVDYVPPNSGNEQKRKRSYPNFTSPFFFLQIPTMPMTMCCLECDEKYLA